MAEVDPFTAEIIQASLAAAGDEMFLALKKTAMSAIIYEVLDMGTGITDADGHLAASGCGIPTFMAVIDKAVTRIIELRGRDNIHPGDMFITNDPYHGAVSHLNDVALLLPVFAGEELVAWTGNIAHWPDVGGMTPGSMATAVTDIYQEGLRLPAVKLFDRGAKVEPVFEIMRANTRLPDSLEGDLWAGIAAVRVGKRRVLELADRYGTATLRQAMADYMDFGERLSLQGLRDLPKGIFEVEEQQETGDVWRARIEIRDDAFVVDLRDNPDQSRGPYNLSRDGALIAATMIFKSVTGPGTVCNGGALRPLRVLTRPGSVFEPLPPAPHGFYFETRIRLHDLLWRCLAHALPHMLPAGHFSSICATVLGGVHPDTGRHYTIVEPQVGGWGACVDRDGVNAMFSGVHGETYNCPAEISEARHGLIVERLELNPEPGGEGRFRGGRGIRAEYRIRAESAFLTVGFSRTRIPPWGMACGGEGTPNYVEVERPSGDTERFAMVTGAKLQQGDLVRIVTGNAGGYGDPRLRAAGQVAEDISNGFLSPERARVIYGAR